MPVLLYGIEPTWSLAVILKILLKKLRIQSQFPGDFIPMWPTVFYRKYWRTGAYPIIGKNRRTETKTYGNIHAP